MAKEFGHLGSIHFYYFTIYLFTNYKIDRFCLFFFNSGILFYFQGSLCLLLVAFEDAYHLAVVPVCGGVIISIGGYALFWDGYACFLAALKGQIMQFADAPLDFLKERENSFL